MNLFRIALATPAYPLSPEDSVLQAVEAIHAASAAGASLVAFPEGYVPGYRGLGHVVPAANPAFLASAMQSVAKAARTAKIAVALGTERLVEGRLRLTVAVFNSAGSLLGFQDKVQLDPSEDCTYSPGNQRQVFVLDGLTFGVSICHEGFRYPETVRWAAVRGAQLVLHPHLSEAEPGSYQPSSYGEQQNSFHEKAVLCRAAENCCFVATLNYASPGSPTTSAVARPNGSLLCYQPYGQAGLLMADLDLDEATLLLAERLRAQP